MLLPTCWNYSTAQVYLEKRASLEQKACDHFFSNIFEKQYTDYKVVEFNNQTDTVRYSGIVYGCENWTEKTKRLIVSTTPGKSTQVIANLTGLRIKKIKENSGRLKIRVFSKIKVGDNYFVLIGAYRKFRFAEYFFMEFDKGENIIATCKEAEII
jgi:hypothetical protein